jgi:cell division protein FtsZ
MSAAQPAAEQRPAPVTPAPAQTPRSSLFEAAAPQAAAPAPVAEEPRIVSKIVDPMADEDYDIAPEVEAPRVETPVSRPTITRPSLYANPQPAAQAAPAAAQPAPAAPQPQTTYSAQPAQAPVSRAPAQAPRMATEEEGRESFWRGLFPQRQQRDMGGIQGDEGLDSGDRYTPAPAKSSAQPAVRPVEQPSMEAEDDLEIPSFLRRLAN